uniref:Transmembrane protein 144a n=1 Tax=Sinocyclocheilus rhinocerous TaxID=307959 RepID=A0A673L9H4_9TELE
MNPRVAALIIALLCAFSSGAAEHLDTEWLSDGPSASVELQHESNSTNSSDLTYGFISCAVSVVFFGSNFVPVKKIETGDGMFFQWILCAAIWTVSLVVNIILHSPKFWPLVMLGGAIWATGNITVVPIVKTIGLGLGLLIWASFNLLLGWVWFGWFGFGAETVSKPVLNFCGAGLCLLSAIVFFFVKTDVQRSATSEETPLLIDHTVNSDSVVATDDSWVDALTPRTKRLVGTFLAVVAGLLYGTSFVPVLYIKNHFGKSRLPHYKHCGIFLTSTVYFVLYCAIKKNKPQVFPKAVLPGFLSGIMWGVATCCWFLANNYLSAVVSFPIITTVSDRSQKNACLYVLSTYGWRNYIVLIVAFCLVLSGALLTAFSKI